MAITKTSLWLIIFKDFLTLHSSNKSCLRHDLETKKQEIKLFDAITVYNLLKIGKCEIFTR
jgi:hypothetical protein